MSELKEVREFNLHGYQGSVEVSVQPDTVKIYVRLDFGKGALNSEELEALCIATGDVKKNYCGLHASRFIERKGLTERETRRETINTVTSLYNQIDAVLTAGLLDRRNDEDMLLDIMSNVDILVER